MPQSFGESFVEGGVSNIKGLVDAITNLPNADISAIRERAYKLSSDVIKYTTDSQYRDSVNQEAMYDDKHQNHTQFKQGIQLLEFDFGQYRLDYQDLIKVSRLLC